MMSFFSLAASSSTSTPLSLASLASAIATDMRRPSTVTPCKAVAARRASSRFVKVIVVRSGYAKRVVSGRVKGSVVLKPRSRVSRSRLVNEGGKFESTIAGEHLRLADDLRLSLCVSAVAMECRRDLRGDR